MVHKVIRTYSDFPLARRESLHCIQISVSPFFKFFYCCINCYLLTMLPTYLSGDIIHIQSTCGIILLHEALFGALYAYIYFEVEH